MIDRTIGSAPPPGPPEGTEVRRAGHHRNRQRIFDVSSVAALVVFVLLSAPLIAARCVATGECYLEDDAHYYRVIAHRLVQSGTSSFDGQTLTNGYHPLWLLVLVGQALTLGSAARITLLIELVLTSAGLWFLLGSFRSKSLFFRVAFAALYAVFIRRYAANGMEISLLLLALGLFMRVAHQRLAGAENALPLAGAAIFCVGARLDSAAFVLPMLILVSGETRRAFRALALVIAAAALYAGANLWFFGMPFPVSGAVKSLGGLQVNRLLIDQMTGHGQWSGGLKPALAFVNSLVGRPLVLFALSGVAFLVIPREWRSRRLCLGFLIGFVLYAVRLMAFSSWRLWSWYSFPEVIALAVLCHVADDFLATTAPRRNLRAEIAASVILLLGAGWQARGSAARIASGLATHNFALINREAAESLGPVFDGARVAMGDRAGSFAWYYAGPVTQLEGLVNDRLYLEALKHQEDIRPLLCARGVRYVLAYQKDLGAYDHVTVPVLRRRLTSYPVPGLRVFRDDEVGRVFDLKRYDNRLDDEGDSYLYAWRLSGCAVASGPE
jgi:hypothetical protein